MDWSIFDLEPMTDEEVELYKKELEEKKERSFKLFRCTEAESIERLRKQEKGGDYYE